MQIKEISEIIPCPVSIELPHHDFKDGHVSFEEYLILAQFVAYFRPLSLLELGTFDGNTTALLAANSPSESIVHTIDLPEGVLPKMSLDSNNLKYVKESKKTKKYEGMPYATKIVNHLGDTIDYSFSNFSKKKALDFIFIDACHLYSYVKNDTEKSLPLLSSNGIIIWHDFSPTWSGVHRYLSELSQILPLTHILDTTLVYCVNNK